MSDLIDRQALEHEMYHEAFETDTDLQRWDSGCWIRYKMFENIIAKQPTIAAEPVMRGRWVSVETDGSFFANYCSICRHYLPYGKKDWEPNYCPHCGAKMEVERRGTDETD